MVAHGPVPESFYNNAAYQKIYHTGNPNNALLNEPWCGSKIYCMRAGMFFYNIKKEELYPWMKVALRAQTVLTNYQLKGYVLKRITAE